MGELCRIYRLEKTDCVFKLLCSQVTKSNVNPDELGGLANQLTTEFGDLASEAKCAAMTAENHEVSSVLLAGFRGLPTLPTQFDFM